MAPQLRKVHGEAADAIRALAIAHPDWGPAQVFRALESKLGKDKADSLPSERTVQRFLKSLSPPDPTAPWHIGPDAEGRFDHEPEDIALVLPIARSLLDDPWAAPGRGPRVRRERLTRAIAEWVIRIRRAYPDLDDAPLVYFLAAAANRGGDLLERAETFLTYTPWRDEGEGLFVAISRGVVTIDVATGFGLVTEYIGWTARQEMAQRKEASRNEQR